MVPVVVKQQPLYRCGWTRTQWLINNHFHSLQKMMENNSLVQKHLASMMQWSGSVISRTHVRSYRMVLLEQEIDLLYDVFGRTFAS
jgi:hypothetical protein